MPINKTQLKSDLEFIVAEDPISVELELTGDNETHNGTKTNIMDINKVIAAGQESHYNFSVMLVLDDWAVVPADGNIIIVNEVRYRIMRSAKDSVDVGLRVDLGSEYATSTPKPSFPGRL